MTKWGSDDAHALRPINHVRSYDEIHTMNAGTTTAIRFENIHEITLTASAAIEASTILDDLATGTRWYVVSESAAGRVVLLDNGVGIPLKQALLFAREWKVDAGEQILICQRFAGEAPQPFTLLVCGSVEDLVSRPSHYEKTKAEAAKSYMAGKGGELVRDLIEKINGLS